MKMKTLATAIQKGGQGKTMATCHLAFDGARRGLRVVVIDLDPQGNASYTLQAHACGLSASQMFYESPNLVPSLFTDRDNSGITLIRNDDGLANIEKLELEDAATLLRTHVNALSEFFDVCLIDTPPFLSNVMASALLSADFVMSPVEMEPYSLQGMELMVAVIQNIRQANPGLQFIGMLPNRYNVKIPRQVENMQILREEYADLVMPFDIRQRDSIAEALGNQIPVWNVKKSAARDATKEVRVMTQYVFEKNGGDPMNAKADKNSQEGAVAPKKAGGMGLGGMKLSGLLQPQAEAVADSALKELPLDLIDEDPNQPRLEDNPGFRPEMIAEIGGTIKARGVKTPISVRENPDAPGRYIINDGARRYRGSKWADKANIWAIVDNDFVPDDQVVANIQREGHTAREIAKLIGQRMASGMKKGEIAKRWGKSPAYITQHAALLDLPAPIAQAFDGGRIADVTLVNELVTAHKSKPQEVAEWLADENQEITRGSVKLLREFLEDGVKRDPDTVDAFNGKTDAEGEGGEGEDVPPKKKTEPKEEDPTKLKKAIVQVEINGDLCRLVLNKRPSEADVAWFKNEVSGEEFEARLASAKLVALVEG